MGAQNTYLEHPRYGFVEQQSFNGALSVASPVGAAVLRPMGLRHVIVLGISTSWTGVGNISLLIEGSLDGVNWFTIAQTAPTEYFTGAGQSRVLNDSGSGLVDIEHYTHFRVRLAGAPDPASANIQVIVTGIARDSERFLFTSPTYTRAGATPTFQNGTQFNRPAGTQLANCQVVWSGVNLGTLVSVDALLQGSPDSGTTWLDIGRVSITTAAGSAMMAVDTETFFGLGAFATLRFRVEDNGAADPTTAFTITGYLSLDSMDWTDDIDSSGSGSFDPGEVFISADFGPPGAEVADTIQIALQLFDADGAPLAEVRKIECIVYDTSQAGDLDLALVATFSAVAGGAAIDGIGTNRVVLTTDATGAATLSVLNSGLCLIGTGQPDAVGSGVFLAAGRCQKLAAPLRLGVMFYQKEASREVSVCSHVSLRRFLVLVGLCSMSQICGSRMMIPLRLRLSVRLDFSGVLSMLRYLLATFLVLVRSRLFWREAILVMS
jgi:hypothetical protein